MGPATAGPAPGETQRGRPVRIATARRRTGPHRDHRRTCQSRRLRSRCLGGLPRACAERRAVRGGGGCSGGGPGGRIPLRHRFPGPGVGALLLCGSYAAWRRKRLHPWTAAGTARVTVLRDWGASLRRRAVEPEPVSTVEFYQKLPYAVALGLGLAWVEAGIRWEVGPPRWMRGEGASLGIVRGWLRGPAR